MNPVNPSDSRKRGSVKHPQKGKAAVAVEVSVVRRSQDGEKYQIDIKATLCPSVTLIYPTVGAARQAREHALKAVAEATEAVLTGDIHNDFA
jgi:hypothetical protein